MPSTTEALKRHAEAVRHRTDRMLTGCAVSINGTPAVSYRPDVDTTDDGGTRSSNIDGDMSTTQQRPGVRRRSTSTWHTSLSGLGSPVEPLPPSLQSSVKHFGSEPPSSRMWSAAGDRTSTVSPSDIIRLADDKQATATAAARRRFLAMTVARSTGNSRTAVVAASDPGDTAEAFQEMNINSSPPCAVPDGAYSLLAHSTDFTAPLDVDK